jgi:hypothetical protein
MEVKVVAMPPASTFLACAPAVSAVCAVLVLVLQWRRYRHKVAKRKRAGEEEEGVGLSGAAVTSAVNSGSAGVSRRGGSGSDSRE